jgi:hypothetical protein
MELLLAVLASFLLNVLVGSVWYRRGFTAGWESRFHKEARESVTRKMIDELHNFGTIHGVPVMKGGART